MKTCDACKNKVYEPGSNHELVANVRRWTLCRYCLWRVQDFLGLKNEVDLEGTVVSTVVIDDIGEITKEQLDRILKWNRLETGDK